MNKTKLAICMKDLEYQARFVNCFMNHYKHQYELHVFTDLEQLKIANPLEYVVIITGEYSTDEMMNFVERGEIILSLTEDFGEKKDALGENFIQAEKYQEVYKIAEIIERLVAEKVQIQGIVCSKAEYERVGVFSLTQEMYQLPFAALLGKIYGEEQKVLIMDLQNYSGFREMEDEPASMGLEDLLSVATTGNYSRGRILECIRHEQNWDYVYPVQNNQCLVEGTKELYETLMDILVQELGYQRIIINFGSTFIGQLEMMEECQDFYLLCGRDTGGRWREETFFRELRRQEKASFIQQLQKIEIPQNSNRESTWNTLAEKWSWTHIGELLRHRMVKEKNYGAAM